jgi:hypothetical protein
VAGAMSGLVDTPSSIVGLGGGVKPEILIATSRQVRLWTSPVRVASEADTAPSPPKNALRVSRNGNPTNATRRQEPDYG